MRQDDLDDDPEDSGPPPSRTVEAGQAIAVLARRRVLERHRVLDPMTHVEPWRQSGSPPLAVDGRSTAVDVG